MAPREVAFHATPGMSAAISNVARYYTNDRKYGGLDNESLPRARSHFGATCDKFGVSGESRKQCIDLALKPSIHNLPQLVQDHLNKCNEEELWTLIEKRVYTSDRMNRIRNKWQKITLSTFPVQPNETAVQTFERIVERLSLLQSQLPQMYHNDHAMVDKLHDLIQGQPFESSIISQNEKNPHQLIDKIKDALHTTHRPPSTTTGTNTYSAATPSPLSALLVDDQEDDVEIDIEECVDQTEPNTVYFVLRKYSCNGNKPHFTKRYRRRPFRGPSSDQPRAICGSPDHWARAHHKDKHGTRYRSHYSDETSPEHHEVPRTGQGTTVVPTVPLTDNT